VAPHLAEADLALYDIEESGSGRARVVRITVAPAAGGTAVDIDTLAALTRALDPIVDELVDGSFHLEVSSPGLERTLRRPEHFAGARGERITVKATPVGGPPVRLQGTLVAVRDDAVDLLDDAGEAHTLAIDDITSARTVFEWGPAPRPGKGTKPGRARTTERAS
jgi:ribosome maturation factor RimP